MRKEDEEGKILGKIKLLPLTPVLLRPDSALCRVGGDALSKGKCIHPACCTPRHCPWVQFSQETEEERDTAVLLPLRNTNGFALF